MKKTRPAKAEEITARLNAVRQTESSELDPLLIGCNVSWNQKSGKRPSSTQVSARPSRVWLVLRVTLVSSPILH